MFEEAMMTFVERFDTMFADTRIDLVDEIFAPEFIGHLPLAPVLDRDGWKACVNAFYTAVPDLVQEINEVIISEDRLVLRITYSGTHGDQLFGIGATRKPIKFDGIGIFRFDKNGLAVENWAVVDVLSILVQIGAFTPV